jgi:hypothetical protein
MECRERLLILERDLNNVFRCFANNLVGETENRTLDGSLEGISGCAAGIALLA